MSRERQSQVGAENCDRLNDLSSAPLSPRIKGSESLKIAGHGGSRDWLFNDSDPLIDSLSLGDQWSVTDLHRRFSQIRRQPSLQLVPPQPLVLRFHYPVSFVRVHHQPARHILTPERSE